jgi:hypothetical protein
MEDSNAFIYVGRRRRGHTKDPRADALPRSAGQERLGQDPGVDEDYVNWCRTVVKWYDQSQRPADLQGKRPATWVSGADVGLAISLCIAVILLAPIVATFVKAWRFVLS